MTDLGMDVFGDGEPAVFVHGSFGWGIDTFSEQVALQENVEILRPPHDSGVVVQGIGPAHQVRHTRTIEHVERIAIQLRCVWRRQQRNISIEHGHVL